METTDDHALFGARTRVPEILAGNVEPGAAIPDPAHVTLSRLRLSFLEDAKPSVTLERAFQARQALRFRTPLRVLTVIFFVVNIALIAYDYDRFMRPANPLCRDAALFTLSLILRVAIMLPACLFVLVYTYSRFYRRTAQPLAFFMAALGAYLVAYSIIGKDPGYGTLALLIVYLFSFTPINFWISGVLVVGLLIAFGIGLWFDPPSAVCKSAQSSLNAGTSGSWYGLDIMGVLIVFTVIVGSLGHNLEFNFRESFLDEYRLQIERDNLQREKNLSLLLLKSMLPTSVIEQLQRGRALIAEQVPEVTVLFCELQFNFYTHAPDMVVKVLNLVYSAFDALLDETQVRGEKAADGGCGGGGRLDCIAAPKVLSPPPVMSQVHKVETVGEVYLCVGGCPKQSSRHAAHAAEMALGMMAQLPSLRQRVLAEFGLQSREVDIRIGLNSGPVAAGVVGIKNPRFKLIGDTVNTASRMESTCLSSRIQMSRACMLALERCDPGRYRVVERGEIAVKGKGTMTTYWLEGRIGEAPLAMGNPDSEDSHGSGAEGASPIISPAPAVNVMPAFSRPVTSASQHGNGASSRMDVASPASVALSTSSAARDGAPVLTAAALAEMGGQCVGADMAVAALAADPVVRRRSSLLVSPTMIARRMSSRRVVGGDDSGARTSQRAPSQRFRADTLRGTAAPVSDGHETVPEADEEDDEGEEDTTSTQEDARLAAYFDAVNAEGLTVPPSGRGDEPNASPPSSSRTLVLSQRHSTTPDPAGLDVANSRGPPNVPSARAASLDRGAPAVPRDDAAQHSGSPARSAPHPRKTSVVAPDAVAVAMQGVTTRAVSSSQSSPLKPIADTTRAVEATGRRLSQGSNGVSTRSPPPAVSTLMSASTRLAVSSQTSAAAPTATRTAADSRRARFYEYAGICLNRPLAKSEAAPWEQTFQRDSLPGWIAFLRTSIVLALGVVVLFLASDYANGYVSGGNYTSLLIIRYGVAAPLLLMFLGLTFLPVFKESYWISQLSSSFTILAIGICIIAASLIGGQPGYGVLALYVVYCLNFSIIALILRLVVLTVLIITFTVAANLQLANSESSSTGIFFAYLLAFTASECVPVFLREHTIRQNYFRQWRIKIERRELATEQARSNKLLENLLPPVIVTRLRSGNRQLIADSFQDVTILWTDMKGFTDFSSTRSPMEIVAFVNAMFSTFDRILDKFGIRKVEVLGDAFFVVGGCPVPSEDHAERCANAAVEMQLHMPILRRFAGAEISMRVGIHTGPVVAGVVGIRDPRYHLFGATVPYANAMESHGMPGRVHISAATFAKLRSRQIARANAFVDWCRGRIGTGSRDAPSAIRTLEASFSMGAYPTVTMELLDDFVTWKRKLDASSRQPIAADTTHNFNGKAPRLGERPRMQSQPSLTALGPPRAAASSISQDERIVPESGAGSLRGQVQLWQGVTFVGWDIRAPTVQGGVLYRLPDVRTATLAAAAAAAAAARADVFRDDTEAAPTQHTPRQVTSAAKQALGLIERLAQGVMQHSALLKPGHSQQQDGSSTDPAASLGIAGSTRRVRVSAAHRSGTADADDIYRPDDPQQFFGPGAGFFSFEERSVDIKGRGIQSTYFLTRAEPPFIPELAQSLAQLEFDLQEWSAAFGREASSGPSIADSGCASRASAASDNVAKAAEERPAAVVSRAAAVVAASSAVLQTTGAPSRASRLSRGGVKTESVGGSTGSTTSDVLHALSLSAASSRFAPRGPADPSFQSPGYSNATMAESRRLSPYGAPTTSVPRPVEARSRGSPLQPPPPDAYYASGSAAGAATPFAAPGDGSAAVPSSARVSQLFGSAGDPSEGVVPRRASKHSALGGPERGRSSEPKGAAPLSRGDLPAASPRGGGSGKRRASGDAGALSASQQQLRLPGGARVGGGSGGAARSSFSPPGQVLDDSPGFSSPYPPAAVGGAAHLRRGVVDPGIALDCANFK